MTCPLGQDWQSLDPGETAWVGQVQVSRVQGAPPPSTLCPLGARAPERLTQLPFCLFCQLQGDEGPMGPPGTPGLEVSVTSLREGAGFVGAEPVSGQGDLWAVLRRAVSSGAVGVPRAAADPEERVGWVPGPVSMGLFREAQLLLLPRTGGPRGQKLARISAQLSRRPVAPPAP